VDVSTALLLFMNQQGHSFASGSTSGRTGRSRGGVAGESATCGVEGRRSAGAACLACNALVRRMVIGAGPRPEGRIVLTAISHVT
jgi:hypothetical protein